MTQVTTGEPSIRGFLLAEVLRFVERARACPGVRRIALIGSLARDKDDPKDADVLVTVDDDADLTYLATAGRRLKGRAQSRNRGADIFLANPSGTYIVRRVELPRDVETQLVQPIEMRHASNESHGAQPGHQTA